MTPIPLPDEKRKLYGIRSDIRRIMCTVRRIPRSRLACCCHGCLQNHQWLTLETLEAVDEWTSTATSCRIPLPVELNLDLSASSYFFPPRLSVEVHKPQSAIGDATGRQTIPMPASPLIKPATYITNRCIVTRLVCVVFFSSQFPLQFLLWVDISTLYR